MFFIGSHGTACARLKTVETLPPTTVSDAPCRGNVALLLRRAMLRAVETLLSCYGGRAPCCGNVALLLR